MIGHMKRKMKDVNLSVEAESMLRTIYEQIDVDHDGSIDTRELSKAVMEDAGIARFFGLDAEPTQEQVKVFFDDVDQDRSRTLTWQELKGWYWKVLKDVISVELENSLPPDPEWLGVGGQRRPEMPLRRISNDDLMEAALRGDVGLVRRLTDSGASVNAPVMPFCEDEIMTLLHVLSGKPEMPNGTRIIAELLHRKADVDARTSMGTSPLIYACQHKHMGAVEVLLKQDADTDVIDDYGCSAARAAVIPRACFLGTDEDESMECYDEAWEQSACELIEMLARWGSDLDSGGLHELPPMTEAVLADSEVVVGTLIESGATAVGLHEAVEGSTFAMISLLVGAEANPFLRNDRGRDVMEIALARGDPDILEICRNFIGKLERESHYHLKTIEILRKQDALLAGQNKLQEMSKNVEKIVVVPLTNWQKFTRACAKMAKNKYYTTSMLLVLAVALFLPDMFVVFQSTNIAVLDWSLVIIMVLFFFEWFFQAVGLWKSYGLTFFFWCDVLGMISVPLDHSLIGQLVMNALGGGDGVDNSVIVRATRLARLGARAGRFTKLVKLLKFLPGMNSPQHKGAGMAKNVAARINNALSMRVAVLIIVQVIILPLFDFFRYPTQDFSMTAWGQMLDDSAMKAPDSILEVVLSMEDFYGNREIYPFEVSYTFANGTNQTRRLSADEPVRKDDAVLYRSGGVELMFNFSSPYQIEAVLNIMMIALISVMMTMAALLVSGSVSKIVLQPLENLLMTVQRIATNIFSSVNGMARKLDRKGGAKDECQEGSEDKGEQAQETILLDKVVNKLQVLSEIALRKKGAGTKEFQSMGEEDRALINTWTNVEAPEMDDEMLRQDSNGTDYGRYDRINAMLLESDVSMDQMHSWDFNVVHLTDKQRHHVGLAILLYHTPMQISEQERRENRAATGKKSPTGEGKPTAACGSGLVDTYNAFISAVSSSYRDPKQVPYHNWLHAVDVTCTMHRTLELCNAENFLSSTERFSLAVAAMCHDIGHPGRSNPFLVETSHELALRYNDSSPLEHMHAAKLFEIVGGEKTAIFGNFARAQVKEARHIIIESILYTDNSKHFGMVSELQLTYGDNKALMDRGQEDYVPGHDKESRWPSREAVEYMKAPEQRKLFRTVFLHFCDISNPMKSWAVCKYWAHHIVEEFFQQGDLEQQLGMPVSPLNNRNEVNQASAQIAFIEFFVAPLIGAVAMVFPPMGFTEAIIVENSQKWFGEWVTSAKPTDEDKQRMADRIKKMQENAKHAAKELAIIGDKGETDSN